MSDQIPPTDSILPVITLRGKLNDLVPLSATAPPQGSADEYSSLLATIRMIRDTYFQRHGEISKELGTAQELAKLHEQRLSHTFAALIAIEELLGETRARFRAKGISIIDPRHLPPRRTPSSAVIESITPGSGTERVEPHVVPTEGVE